MMSIALESSSNSIQLQGSGFIGGGMSSCVSILEPGRKVVSDVGMQDRGFPAADREQEASSCSSSSIGGNRDCSGGQLSSSGSDGEDSEVQSSYKGKGPLYTMDSLEDSLPIRFRRI